MNNVAIYPLRQQDRLARAVHLDAVYLCDGQWGVSGGGGRHVVDVRARSCDCGDYVVHHGVCSHLATVLLALGDPPTMAALRALVPAPKRRPRQRRSA